MYKFYKIFRNGKEKLCGTYDTTLHPDYHGYIDWCRENKISWKLVDTTTGQIKYSEDYYSEPVQ